VVCSIFPVSQICPKNIWLSKKFFKKCQREWAHHFSCLRFLGKFTFQAKPIQSVSEKAVALITKVAKEKEKKH
jgi:hypothetical protein